MQIPIAVTFFASAISFCDRCIIPKSETIHPLTHKHTRTTHHNTQPRRQHHQTRYYRSNIRQRLRIADCNPHFAISDLSLALRARIKDSPIRNPHSEIRNYFPLPDPDVRRDGSQFHSEIRILQSAFWILPTAYCMLYTPVMSLFSDRAVVLRRLDYSETSQILALFTRAHGLVRAIAKGIKRGTKTRFAAAIDLLEVGEVVWSARTDRQQNLAILTEWKQIKAFVGLREKLERLYAAQYAAEVTAELTVDHDPHTRLFDALADFLEAVSGSDQALVHLCKYQRDLLMEIGLMPRCDICVGCRRELRVSRHERAYFSSHQGGLLCRDCELSQVEKRLVNAGTVRAARGGEITEAMAIEVFDLLNYHISHLMQKEPKLAELIVPAVRRRQLGTPGN